MNWLDRAVEACEGARWAEALEWCERGLAQEPDDLELQHRKGLCLLELGDEQAAITALEAAAASGHLESHYQLGLLAMRQGRRNARFRERSLAHFEAIVRAAEALRRDANTQLSITSFSLLAVNTTKIRSGVEKPSARSVRGWRSTRFRRLATIAWASSCCKVARCWERWGNSRSPSNSTPSSVNHTQIWPVLFFRHVKPPELEQEYQHICDEFEQSAPQVLARLSLEMVELGKEQVYEGFYTKGHRIKNLMGIIGSRLRGLGRKAEEAQRGELNRLGGEYEALYDEWVGSWKR